MLIRHSNDTENNSESARCDCQSDSETEGRTDGKERDEEILIAEDEYYRVGDYVDAVDSETGAWFEAKITRISKTANKSGFDHKYCVDFEKQSIGTNIALNLQQIRPQSSKLIAFEDLNEGQVVLANFSAESDQRGYWYDCRIEKKSTKSRALYGSICMAGVVLERQRIRLIDEIYAIEANSVRSERSPEDEVLIRLGAKAKREF